ncbi:MAG: hypothetical protein A6F72_04265 [Cycloclasticus sp. symbiont of Poecilosclerida sp. N]|nr:MAG: hypothetical protein A6F72_04265 [Cycloclasticus sp. symbiont of Poecilosclerida sp. N]
MFMRGIIKNQRSFRRETAAFKAASMVILASNGLRLFSPFSVLMPFAAFRAKASIFFCPFFLSPGLGLMMAFTQVNLPSCSAR